MGREEFKWHKLSHHQLMSQHKGLILVHTVKLKPIIKVQISGKLVTSGISNVVTASVYLEKTRLKKLMKIIIIIMNKLQETTVFHGCQKENSAMN